MPDGSSGTRLATAAIKPGTAVAVTGATGFIGGRLVEVLVGQGCAVTCLVRGTTVPHRLRNTGASLVVLDLANPEAVCAALAGVELVFHCAYNWEGPEWNLRALDSLLEGCRANGCSRLVHFSSFVVYDLPQHGEVTEQTAGETSASGYAHTKRQMEDRLLRAVREDGVPATMIQPTIVYGPYAQHWTTDPADMLRHGTIVLPDAGQGLCNAVYVDDVVDAAILAAQNPVAVGKRYLVSGPAPITWARFYQDLARAIGAKGPQYRSAASLAQRSGKLGEAMRLAADPGHVVRRVARIGPVRKLLDTALAAMPKRLRVGAHARLYGPEASRAGCIHLPNPGQLGFLQIQAAVHSEAARRDLGYAPRFDFAAGLAPTAQFLKERHSGQHGIA